MSENNIILPVKDVQQELKTRFPRDRSRSETSRNGVEGLSQKGLEHNSHQGQNMEYLGRERQVISQDRSPRRELELDPEPVVERVSEIKTSESGVQTRSRTKSESRPKYDERTTNTDSVEVLNLLRNPKRRPIEVDAREFRFLTEKLLQEQKGTPLVAKMERKEKIETTLHMHINGDSTRKEIGRVKKDISSDMLDELVKPGWKPEEPVKSLRIMESEKPNRKLEDPVKPRGRDESAKPSRKSRREYYELESKSKKKGRTRTRSPDKSRACSRQDCISGDENEPESPQYSRHEKEWLKEKLLEEFEKQDKKSGHKSRSSKSSDILKHIKSSHQKEKDSRKRKSERKDDFNDFSVHHSPTLEIRSIDLEPGQDNPTLELSRKPSRSGILDNETDTVDIGLDPFYKRAIPPQPTSIPLKLPKVGSDRKRDWTDISPSSLEPPTLHYCRDSYSNPINGVYNEKGRSTSHSVFSGVGLRDQDSPFAQTLSPPHHSTMPRNKSPNPRHEKHATMPRNSSPSCMARFSSSAASMPSSPPPYVDPKASDKDCGCSCDCRSSGYPSQEVRQYEPCWKMSN